MLTSHEAAGYLRLSQRTLERLRCSSLGPKFIRCGRRSVRYCQSDLDQWIASRVVRSTSEELALAEGRAVR
jgi:predicted DNA-binding transcriptional regulator AlpA